MGSIDIDAAAVADRAESAASEQSSQPIHLDETLKFVQESENGSLPDRYKWDSPHRDGQQWGLPGSADVPSKLTTVLPVIDLKDLQASHDPTARERLVKEIGVAAEEWGFFQVKNHGIPKAFIDNMMSCGTKFFVLPKEKKERAVFTPSFHQDKNPYYQGYGGRFQHLQTRVPWMEHLGEIAHPCSGVENLAKILWPESNGNAPFCQTVHEVNDALTELGVQIMELLAEHLGLGADFFSKHFTEEKAYQSNWRFNHYPACPAPDQTLGLGPHTDPNALTIVIQDGVGGFQLRNNDVWFDLDPVPDTLLVNIGDALKAWTNGRFRSVMHRAVVNKQQSRLSFVFFLSPQEDTPMEPPSSLIDADHPPKSPSPAWSHLFRSPKLYAAQLMM